MVLLTTEVVKLVEDLPCNEFRRAMNFRSHFQQSYNSMFYLDK